MSCIVFLYVKGSNPLKEIDPVVSIFQYKGSNHWWEFVNIRDECTTTACTSFIDRCGWNNQCLLFELSVSWHMDATLSLYLNWYPFVCSFDRSSIWSPIKQMNYNAMKIWQYIAMYRCRCVVPELPGCHLWVHPYI